MRKTVLGRSGLRVSRIAFGTWQLGGEWGRFDRDAAIAAIRHAHDQGVTLFDTARAYGRGAAESLLGEALRDRLRHHRDEVLIATKGGVDPGSERPRDAGRAALRSDVERSLRALGVEYIDLFQVHWPDPDTPAEETAAALRELVEEGKVRHAGVSNYEAEGLAALDEVYPAQTLQVPYHLFRRGIEADTLPYAAAHEIGVLAYSPLASGLLTGTLHEDSVFEPGDWRAGSEAFRGEILRRNLAVVKKLVDLASARGLSIGQLAIAWVLAQPGVHAAIVGARGVRTIDNSLAAADVELSQPDLAEIEQIVAEGVPILGPSPESLD
jgi:aryl-alcohol dehydrogenase-like predicted oxidoreductase